MAETKQQLLKEIKVTANEVGDLLQKDQFEEANDLVDKLKKMLNSELVNEMTMAETRSISYEELVADLKKYKYWLGEFRKARGALRKKGDHIQGYVS